MIVQDVHFCTRKTLCNLKNITVRCSFLNNYFPWKLLKLWRKGSFGQLFQKKILCRGLKFSKISSWKNLIEVMWLSWAWRRIFRFSGQVLINRDILDLQVLMRQNEVWNENPKTVFEQISLSECKTFHKNNDRKKTWISN